jgi:antitoxin (DNA-binding transcriptional repressor) of toxin-antitoxin stability system
MNVLEAKTNFSKIIAMLERKEEKEVIIARAGKPVVKMTLLPQKESMASKLGMFKDDPRKPIITDEKWDPCAWSDEELKEIWGDLV